MNNPIMPIFAFVLALVMWPLTFMQQGGNGSGRTTGAAPGVHSNTFNTSIANINCTGTTCAATSGVTTPGPNVAVTGTLHFVPSHDFSGSIGGSTGGGTGLVQVSCDGGSTWNTYANGAATLPSTTMTPTYSGTACTGPTNLNTLQFRAQLGGGGATGFNMSMVPTSQITVTW